MSNPLNDIDKASNIREGFIAKIKSLKIFNRTKIHANERQGAEFDYMKKYFQEYLSVKDCASQDSYKNFFENHPRYLEYIKSYNFLINRIFSIKVKFS